MNRRWTEGVRREVLPNGLTLLAQPIPGATAVATHCHVRTGFFDEPDPLTGVSHVLEHMLFKGTPTRGVGEIAREMKAAGGYLNAGTGYDHTSYYAVLPPESLSTALDLQADALRRSRIDPEELKRELRVIIEEAKRKLDTPSAVTAETLHALLFDRHRIRRWRIGTEAQLAALSHADVVGFYRSRYVPSRTVVALAGALDPDRALALARECFEGWEAAEPTTDPSPAEPLRHEVRARTLRGDIRQGELALGWRAVPALHADAAGLDVAALLLSAGRASRLYRALRAPGLVSSVSAVHFTPTEVGVFSVHADLDPGQLSQVLEVTGECLAQLRENGPTDAELARARVLLLTRWARRLQTAEGRAGALAAAEALGGVEILEEEFERLLAVDAAVVRRVTAEWLRPDAIAAVAYLPEAAPHALDAGPLRSAFERKAGTAPDSPEVLLPTLPRPVPARGKMTGDILHVALAGADLLLARKPGVPLVSLGIYRRRTVSETLKTAGLGALAVRTAVRGAAALDASALALGFERLGGTVTPALSADWFGFGTSVLSTQAAEAAALLQLVLRSPSFEREEIARERATLADEAAQLADDMVRYPIQLALRGAFGDSGYGIPSLGLPDSIPALADGMLSAWHACELAAGRTLFVAVGELEPEPLAEQLAAQFEAEPPRAHAPRPADVPWSAALEIRGMSERRVKRQTALAMLFPGPSRADPNRFAAELWCAIASGLGGRLFSALREQRSLAYTLFASSWQRSGAGALLLYLATSPEREAEAREALLGELVRFAEQPPEPEELSRAINYLTGQIPVQRQTAGAIAAEIADAWLMGTGLEELLDPAEGYRAVSGGAIQQVAAGFLDPGQRVEGIVRGQ
ncbi:MAG TPA: insulinase family protein [Gemmatimonadales bacterium]|nr:insulinase family protein [Gemmatimonadales bacterium]